MLRTTFKPILRARPAPLHVCMQKRFYDEKPTPHTTEKTHDLDVQSNASKRGMKEHQESLDKSETHSKKQDPKKDHPEAPGPVIGMQDEIGRKGA